MRFMTILFVLFLYACGGDTASQNPAPAKPAMKASGSQATKTDTKITGFASAAAIKEADTPVYGKGKANIIVKVKGATPGPSDLIGFYAEQNYKVDETTIGADGTITFNCQQCADGQTTYPQGLYYVLSLIHISEPTRPY